MFLSQSGLDGFANESLCLCCSAHHCGQGGFGSPHQGLAGLQVMALGQKDNGTDYPFIPKLLPFLEGAQMIAISFAFPGEQAENQNTSQHAEPHLERDAHLLRHHRRGHDPQDPAVGPGAVNGC